MAGFFKKFGQGILYVLVLPLFLVVLALYSVYGIVIFFIMMIKSLISFFKGKSLYNDLPEDIEAKRRIAMINNPFEPREEPKKEERDPIVIIEKPNEERTIEIKSEPNPIEYKDTPSQVEFNTINEVGYDDEPPLPSPKVFPEIRDSSIDEEIEYEKLMNAANNVKTPDINLDIPEEEPPVEDNEEDEDMILDEEITRFDVNDQDEEDEILPPDDKNNLYEDFDDNDDDSPSSGVTFNPWEDDK